MAPAIYDMRWVEHDKVWHNEEDDESEEARARSWRATSSHCRSWGRSTFERVPEMIETWSSFIEGRIRESAEAA
jgi:hypothetical protein